jgi:hypothetical protein
MIKAVRDLRGIWCGFGFVALLGAAIGIAGAAEWKRIGFEGEAIHALTIHPKETATIYVGTDKGLFKSTDGGSRWEMSLPVKPLGKLYCLHLGGSKPPPSGGSFSTGCDSKAWKRRAT